MTALDLLLVIFREQGQGPRPLEIAGFSEDQIRRLGTKLGRQGSRSQRDWGTIG